MIKVRGRSKSVRAFVALVTAFAWSYGPMLPASVCLANGGMLAEGIPARPAYDHHEGGAADHETPRHGGCTDAGTSCCLHVSPDGAVGATGFELMAPGVTAVSHVPEIPRVSRTLVGAPTPAISPPKQLSFNEASILRL